MDKINLPIMGPCPHCGYLWFPRKPIQPNRCAKCKRKIVWKKK